MAVPQKSSRTNVPARIQNCSAVLAKPTYKIRGTKKKSNSEQETNGACERGV
jgi:hypothetical protein